MRFPAGMIPDTDTWKSGLRTAVGAGLASVITYLLALPQGYWAVITAIIIIQTRIGASLQAAGDRVIGTLAGAAFGFVAALLTPGTPLWTLFALIVCTGVLAMLAAKRPSLRIAPMTAAILLVATPSHTLALISAVHRVSEILIGCAIGIFVSLVVAPARSDTSLRNEGKHAVGLLAGLIDLDVANAGKAPDEAAIRTVGEDIHISLAKIETLANEVREEQASHISRSKADPFLLRHNLWGLRTSIFLFHRAMIQPSPVSDALSAPLGTVSEAVRAALLSLGDALAGGVAPPATNGLDDAIAGFDTAARAVAGQAAVPADQAAHAAAHVSNLIFALGQVRHSIEQLAGCVTDMADAT
ncbi:hypothetical protein K32_22560 [Kaistia sp. 32K]|uniref:FUSC family protein n=1 Tax=Kaistia sp. 32K TaxID=2795690 RepID=UPI0019163AB7|nr:FUSC family protein [Kaistia sp. 32K]BCP53639.1 hypothetical protein K32_22560 [Kaistia sp. 32K]